MNKVLTDYYKIREGHDIALATLGREVSRIVSVIKQVLKLKKDAWWSYQYYECEGEDPLPEPIQSDDTLPIYISHSADSGSWFYHEGIPVKFFDMTDQEIETYLRAEIVENFRKEAAAAEKKRLKKEAKKSEKMLIVESAIKKLTKEERKALGLK